MAACASRERRDEYKDLASSISNAEAFFAVRDQLLDVFNRLSYISDLVDGLSPTAARDRRKAENVRSFFGSAEDMADSSDMQLKMLQELARKVPISQQLGKELQAHTEAVDRFRELLEREEDLVSTKTRPDPAIKDIYPGITLDKLEDRVEDQFESSRKLLSKTTDLRESTLKEAREFRENSEKLLNRYSKASWIFYALGLSITTFAKIFGAKDPNGSE